MGAIPRLSFVLDQLAETTELGAVGAAGFSLGGSTAAALLGARLDRRRYEALLSGGGPLPAPPEYPDLERELRERLSGQDVPFVAAAAGEDYADARVRAAFRVCPALRRCSTKPASRTFVGPSRCAGATRTRSPLRARTPSVTPP